MNYSHAGFVASSVLPKPLSEWLPDIRALCSIIYLQHSVVLAKGPRHGLYDCTVEGLRPMNLSYSDTHIPKVFERCRVPTERSDSP